MNLANEVSLQKKILPYFQPIISLEDGKIFGYEALGRLEENGSVKSMGYFFSDDEISSKEKLYQDRDLRKKALSFYQANIIDQDEKPLLFININPSWIEESAKRGVEIFPSILMMQELGIDGRNIVIEVTEHEYSNDLAFLNRLLQQYRDFGCPY
ncbi:MAG: EAL domain-containing protein [Spirochaetales bacterium]|nr:EAL domain-containing protein [Spirochaetales bacterium]